MAEALSHPPAPATYRNRWIAWAMYDWANSAVVTLVIAAVFPIFYNSVAEPQLGKDAGSAFSFAITISLLLSAIIGPVVGTLADVVGSRKRLLVICTVIGAAAVCAMFTIRLGAWVWATVLFVVVQIFLNTSLSLYDALLSHIARAEDRDRISAAGYALGYVGGGLLLAIGLGLILKPATFGLDGTETATRIALALSGIWWLVFAIPLFVAVPEPPASPLEHGATGNPLGDTFKRMGSTFRAIRSYRELFKMLVAFWLYSDGIGTIIQLATTYGRSIGLDQTILIGALLLTQVVAFPFSIMFGRMPKPQAQNRSFFVAFILWTIITFPLMGVVAAANDVGTGTTFIMMIGNQALGVAVCWFVGSRLVAGLAAQMTTKRGVLFGLSVYAIVAIWAFFLHTAAEFWMLAWLVGTVQGGTQALSRSLYASLSPSSKSGEFFGFYGFSDKFAGILGPLVFGLVGLATGGNLRFSILSVVIFFIVGGLLLARVNEAEGQRHAEHEDAQIGYRDDLPAAT